MELWLTRIKVVPNLNVDLGENEPSITEWQTPKGINLLDLSATPPTDSCYECDFHYLMLFLIRLLRRIKQWTKLEADKSKKFLVHNAAFWIIRGKILNSGDRVAQKKRFFLA